MTADHPVILAIDPGPTESAWLVYNPFTGGIRSFAKVDNDHILGFLRGALAPNVTTVVIEQIESFGMPVGREVFETVRWSGRFEEACGRPVEYLPRRAVKLQLCGSSRAKDPNVRQAVLDRYGGKDRAIGKKSAPGPLYGIHGDVWSALAVAITWSETEP